jgi:hypothetical protein
MLNPKNKRQLGLKTTIMIAVAIGAVEFAITIVFELFPKMDPLVESLVDAVVLSCLAAWIIRNWLILPMLDNSRSRSFRENHEL